MNFLKKSLAAALVASSATFAIPATSAWADGHSKTIVQTASETDALSTLTAAVTAAGLVDTLNGDGPFTVFAPTNDAFGKLPDGTVDTLVKPENKETLTGILTYHVVAGKVMAADVVKLITDNGGKAMVKTVNGAELALSLDGDSVVITDAKGGTATVAAADLEQSNGGVHVIDSVLMPQ